MAAPTTIRQPADLQQQIAELRRQLAQLEAQARSARDAALATALLPALAFAVGDEPFQADDISEAREPNIRYVVGRCSTRSIGKFLCRIQGRPFGGYVIVDVGKVFNRRQWRLQRIVS